MTAALFTIILLKNILVIYTLGDTSVSIHCLLGVFMFLEDYLDLPLNKNHRTDPAYKGISGHPLYNTWRTMMYSCYKTNCSMYKYVGANNIRVCTRWHDVLNFIADVKVKPHNSVFIRKDKTRDFSPDNYEWTTRAKSTKVSLRKDSLDQETKQNIIKLKQSGKSNKYIALTYNISSSTVTRILARHMAEQSKVKKLYRGEQSIAEIKQLRKQGKKIIEIAVIYDLSYTHVQNILNNRSFA